MSNKQTKYDQIAQHLKAQIHSGKLKKGEQFPTEFQLMDHYGVSRNTVRKAIEKLINEGLLYRDHGFGTFISSITGKIHYRLDTFYENAELLRHAGYTPTVEILDIQSLTASSEFIKTFNLHEEQKIYRIQKLFKADGRPAMYCEDFIPEHLISFDSINQDESLTYFDFLQNQLGIRIAFVLVEIKPVIPSEVISWHLECPPDMPILLFKEQFLGQKQEKTWAYGNNYYHPDFIHFRLLMQCQ
jgi:GntR family transcriptional regulator